jgi:hypothetical protein
MPDIDIEEREAACDVLHRYIWCMDTVDIEGVVSTFSADARIRDVTGRHWDGPDAPRRFASHFLLAPNRPLSQHWVQHLDVDAASDRGLVVTSYWYTVRDDAGFRGFSTLGRYIDTLVRVDGAWLIREKIIDPWNDRTVAHH